MEDHKPFIKMMIMKWAFTFLLCLLSGFKLHAQAQSKPAAGKANISFLLADNLGYGVPSCYNGGILDIPAPILTSLLLKVYS
jgi:hypothetical protein